MPPPWFGSPIPDRINMLQPGHQLQGTGPIHDSVSKADNVNQWTILNTVFNGGANVNTVSLGALATAPDGTNTGQKIVEATNNGLHQMQSGVFMNAVANALSGMPLRLAVIAKAAERTRIVLTVQGPNNDWGVRTVFDLAGVQIGVAGTRFGTSANWDPDGRGITLIAVADTITSLGNGWCLCIQDIVLGDPRGPVWTALLSLDNGSGTAARSDSYAGDGTSGVLTWRSNMLPTGAYGISQQSFFDDFLSMSTIDANDTRASGFNWYTHMTFPHFFFTGPPTPGSYTVSGSVLTCQGTNDGFKIEVLNTCAVAPFSPDSPTLAPQFSLTGKSPYYIGKAFKAPYLMEANLHWDDTSFTSRPPNPGTSFWSGNIGTLFDLSPPGVGGKGYLPHLETDMYEDFQDFPKTTLFTVTPAIFGNAEISAIGVTNPADTYPIWTSAILYTPVARVFYLGTVYDALQQTGPGGTKPATVPGTDGTIWNPLTPGTPPLGPIVAGVNYSNFHTYSILRLPYNSKFDPGIFMMFFDGMATVATTYGPDCFANRVFQITDDEGFPIFLQTAINYSLFVDWVSVYQSPQSTLSSLLIHDFNATPQNAQAIDLSNAGTGPWSSGRFTLDGIAGVIQGCTSTYGLGVDASALTQPVQESTSSVATQTSVTSSASAVILLSPNPARLGATIYNESTQILYILLQLDPQLTVISNTDYTVQVAPNTRYELPNWYVGYVSGIWASANGFARITEMT